MLGGWLGGGLCGEVAGGLGGYLSGSREQNGIQGWPCDHSIDPAKRNPLRGTPVTRDM
jgi:hypothetical protein